MSHLWKKVQDEMVDEKIFSNKDKKLNGVKKTIHSEGQEMDPKEDNIKVVLKMVCYPPIIQHGWTLLTDWFINCYLSSNVIKVC